MKRYESDHDPSPLEGFPSDVARGGAVIECARAADELHRYVEGELDGVRRLWIDAHLAVCAACRDAVSELRCERNALIASILRAPARPPADFAQRVFASLDRETRVSEDRRALARFRAALRYGAAAALLIAAFGAGVWSGRLGIEHPTSIGGDGAPPAAVANDRKVSELRAGVDSSSTHGRVAASTGAASTGAASTVAASTGAASTGAASTGALGGACSRYELDLIEPAHPDHSLDPLFPVTHVVCASCAAPPDEDRSGAETDGTLATGIRTAGPLVSGALSSGALSSGALSSGAGGTPRAPRWSEAVRVVEVAFRDSGERRQPCYDTNADGKTDAADAVYIFHHWMGSDNEIADELALRDLGADAADRAPERSSLISADGPVDESCAEERCI